MIKNNTLRIHVVNVGHGDSIVVEFPDEVANGRRPRFGLVDAGGDNESVKTKTADYLRTFLQYRHEASPSTSLAEMDYRFEFICLTHPHADHLYGMMPVLEEFADASVPASTKPRQFWDCGFRYNTVGYRKILKYLSDNSAIQFLRVTSGTEFHYGDSEVLAIAPSIDMRNRYDTYGVCVNDASIVLRITLGKGVAILTGDAHFDSWGKVCEEFPRTKHVVYPPPSGGTPDVSAPDHDEIAFVSQANQLNCQLLKVSHHGSKRGTSYEYIEKLSPSHFAIPCDSDSAYSSTWKHKFPHPITRLILGEEVGAFTASSSAIPATSALQEKVGTTAELGTLVYKITRGGRVTRASLGETKGKRVKIADFVAHL
jgi:beta-lactamase superfamily II metal-dependent hydrolase